VAATRAHSSPSSGMLPVSQCLGPRDLWVVSTADEASQRHPVAEPAPPPGALAWLGRTKWARWTGNLLRLLEHVQRHGTADVPQESAPHPPEQTGRGVHGEPGRLGLWVMNQRLARERGKLHECKEAILTRIGFSWCIADSRWEAFYKVLLLYRLRHGHACVGTRVFGRADVADVRRLAVWVEQQKHLGRRQRLLRDRRVRLEAAGVFDAQLHGRLPADTRPAHVRGFRAQLRELARFRRVHGHCRVPQDGGPGSPALGKWVWWLRTSRRRGSLSADKVAALDRLGFAWDARIAAWEEMVGELVCFRQQHGHAAVVAEPRDGVERPGTLRLAVWLANQRQELRRGSMPPSRQRRLQALGVEWAGGVLSSLPPVRQMVVHATEGGEAGRGLWTARLYDLLRYRQAHGHCDVPAGARGSGDATLARWVRVQRSDQRAGRIAAWRVAQLEAAGLAWDRGQCPGLEVQAPAKDPGGAGHRASMHRGAGCELHLAAAGRRRRRNSLRRRKEEAEDHVCKGVRLEPLASSAELSCGPGGRSPRLAIEWGHQVRWAASRPSSRDEASGGSSSGETNGSPSSASETGGGLYALQPPAAVTPVPGGRPGADELLESIRPWCPPSPANEACRLARHGAR
jgi:hypothetical protein